jgi:hypothetical protein
LFVSLYISIRLDWLRSSIPDTLFWKSADFFTSGPFFIFWISPVLGLHKGADNMVHLFQYKFVDSEGKKYDDTQFFPLFLFPQGHRLRLSFFPVLQGTPP